MDVKKLSVDVQCLLSASAKVNTYTRVVEELVYNSLDAESTCIAIRIHIQNNWIQVIDNGIGIKKTDFKLLGERYATSKFLDINTLKAIPSQYGYQGQALANIIEVSHTVKITSRCGVSNDTWVKTFVAGKIERECFKEPMRPSKGTTVAINGFLYNLNIQKKFLSAFNELQDIKTFLEQLLLVFNNVSISLRDDSENEIIFKMHKNRDIYQTLRSLFDIDMKDFQELQVEKNEYKVKAFIGIEKTGIKNCHWIYLNNKFLNISNLHKIINEKFAKPDNLKHKKIKTMEAYRYSKEKSILFVPFYILFITCPYSEYDIINSGKQTTIEFKDWLQINNLIEKLVKFYNGDITLINKQKNDNPNQNSKNVEDIRDEVKKIMERILGKPNKTAQVSQMQNGVKGKQVKRKKKKQQVNISLTKIIPPKIYKNLENSVKVKLSENKVIKKAPSEHSGSNGQPKPLENNSKPRKTKHKKRHKITKSYLKCKCTEKYDHTSEIFKISTLSVQRRCEELSSHIEKILNSRNCKQIKDQPATHVRNQNPIVKNKQGKCKIKEGEMYMTKPNFVEFKRLSDYKRPANQHIRSYDLLQTVIKTQQGFYDQELEKEDAFRTTNRSNVLQETYTKSYYAPKLTFESHKYNTNSNSIQKKMPQNVQFISKQSRDNFNIGVNKYKGNIQIKTGKVTKHRGLININNKKKHDNINFNKLFNKYKQDGLETLFSIDTSGTDIVEVSKQIRNQIMNDMNSLFDKEDYDKIHSPKSQLNFEVNLNIEGTYTILVDSLYNSSQACNVHKYRKTFIDETVGYTKVSDYEPIHSHHTYEISKDIFLSEPTRLISEHNFDEPLDICEAILNSSNDTENDIKNNSNIARQHSSLLFEESRNFYNQFNVSKINKSHANVSKSKTSTQENSETAVQSKENEEKSGIINTYMESLHQIRYRNENFSNIEPDMIQDNSVHNFKLHTRHRFVPKGMSQIFTNCFTKNICSYNLDTEYYENTIYNNFVADVAVNSEIFEPKVQNLKEFPTEDAQKVTKRLNKHNADLVFGTDSLRNAKVLGQVDSKFIAAIIKGVSQTNKSPELLVLFDQHAVHERIMLENNLLYYFTDNKWRKVTIDAVSVKSSEDEVFYLHNHKDKFTRFGLMWTVLNNSEILVNAIPKAIRGNNPRPVEIIAKAVKNLILEQMHAIKQLKGNVSLYPQSIMNLVFSEACRYAIKFGDKLSVRDCVELIAALADCKIPFQCAHGRPVMAVMVELKNEPIVYKANMESIKKFKNGIKK